MTNKQPESVEKFNWDKYYREKRNDTEIGPHIKRAEKVGELELLHHKGGFEAILEWHKREVRKDFLRELSKLEATIKKIKENQP